MSDSGEAGHGEAPNPHQDARAQAASRALASPVRLRILRYCLYDARSNREIAAQFGLNPGTSLHHVRTLVENGFLAAEEARAGKRGSSEIPYRATGLSWNTPVEGQGALLIRTFLDEIEGHELDEMFMARMGFKLTPERLDELRRKLVTTILEYHENPDDNGELHSLFLVVHPEERPRAGTQDGAALQAPGSV